MSTSNTRPWDPEQDPEKKKPGFRPRPLPVTQKPPSRKGPGISQPMKSVLKKRLAANSRKPKGSRVDDEEMTHQQDARFTPTGSMKGASSAGPYPGPNRALMPEGMRGKSTTGGRATMPTRR